MREEGRSFRRRDILLARNTRDYTVGGNPTSPFRRYSKLELSTKGLLGPNYQPKVETKLQYDISITGKGLLPKYIICMVEEQLVSIIQIFYQNNRGESGESSGFNTCPISEIMCAIKESVY